MPMHLGFIEYIAQSGQFPPRLSPAGRRRTGSATRFCARPSPACSVVLGAGRARGVSAADAARIFVSVYGMFWQLARRMTGQRRQGVSGVLPVFYGQRVRFCVLSRQMLRQLAGIFTGFYTTPTNFVDEKHRVGQPHRGSADPPAGNAVRLVRAVCPHVYLLWRFCV